ncbi:Imm7 family immunity protein [Paenibacillus piscarius]|uniref:Imm7 family immunity protein n=1 Tax=Paenibacillus piscarius TaxID=1089681 RepID=UPI00308427D8
MNGIYHLSVSGFLNRKTSEIDELMMLYQFIANEAPGSYGLLYARDDEDNEGFDNEFKVFVLKQGGIQQKEDYFLSPFNLKVEDI